jgi:PDZ domain
MAEDREHEQALRQHVAELVALERDIEGALEHQREKVRAHPEVSALVRRCREIASSHRGALQAHLERLAGDDTAEPTETAVVAVFGASAGEAEGEQTRTVSDTLRADYTAFNYAAISYAVLCEMGFRLYDPPLREIAERHLLAYAEATQQINQLIASVVAWELEQQGLECRCICPMCSMGACGCVAAGTWTVNEAWRETAPSSSGQADRGFLLLPPRAGSPLAVAGVQGGERLLKVDDQPVASIADIQTAIRKHPLGEKVRVLVQRGSEAPREIDARHISDLPST